MMGEAQRWLRRLESSVLDLLFPSRCVGCGSPGSWLCPDCRQAIALILPPFCPRCGRPADRREPCSLCRHSPPALDGIRSVAYHEGALREAIHRFKYRNGRGLAGPLGELLANYVVEHSLPADVLVPVPLHPARLADRGFNQAALLAGEMGQHLGVPVVADSLLRVRHTRQQVGLNAEERRVNVADAFACRDDRLAGRRVLLIDDVYTTGATLDACGLALATAGTTSAWGLTLAHGR